MSSTQDSLKNTHITSASGSDAQANPLKRKRPLLPLGIPPPQPVSPSVPQETRAVLRVNRACNTCRRQKMRCDGPDTGAACSRCQNAGVECIFEKVPPNKPVVVPAASRLSSLEEKMEVFQAAQVQMQNSLLEILELLRGNLPRSDPARAHASDSSQTSLDRTGNLVFHQSTHHSATALPHTDSATTPPIFRNVHAASSPSATLLSPCHTPSDNSDGIIASKSDEQRIIETSQPTKSFQVENDPVTSHFFQDINDDSQGSSTPRATGNLQLHEDDNFNPHTKRLGSDARQVLREDGYRTWNEVDPIKEFRNEDGVYPDPAARGLLSERMARDLFSLFFDHCHPRMPIFDTRIDTFDSIRQRSPFCFCSILMVAVTARDGSQPTTLQTALWEETMMRGKESMFQRVKDLEVIQGLILLSCWSESTGGTCWIVLGHAIRCSVEMGLHKALLRLASGPVTDDERARILVTSARLWCALFAFEHQLSFGIGRHTMTGNPRSIKAARQVLLKHPLSQLSDMRLVFACEILVIEYEALETLPSTNPEDPRSVSHFAEARKRMDMWEQQWTALLAPHYSDEDYMFQTLHIQRYYGYMTVHMAGMPRMITSSDLNVISHQEKDNCHTAVWAAREILRISVEKASYRDGLRYSPTCFYSGVAFVGSLVLRLEAVLQEQQSSIYRDGVQLYYVLQDVPTCRFKFSFVSLLREKNMIPQSEV
ncbi:hypothetical protein M422DRAFT_777385 [Sphaerobolus stellatus SS14]|nr:hypothetical protein M422DRAFT_777385 [Sphaerobolus stellatus SS14]